jgi:hypothetical protein
VPFLSWTSPESVDSENPLYICNRGQSCKNHYQQGVYRAIIAGLLESSMRYLNVG